MANWYKKAEAARYRAVVPMDVWIESTGDDQTDQNVAYDTIKNILNRGSQSVPNQGFNDLMQLSDVQKYSDTIPFQNEYKYELV